MLNDNERKKYEIIKKVINNIISRKEAAAELGITRQQIYRLIIKYHNDGENGFSHKNKNKIPTNKKDKNLIEKLENLYLEKHHDFNFEHFYEDHVFGKYDISYDVMLKRFTEDDIISPLAHKKTIQLYKEKMKTVVKEDNLIQIKKKQNYSNQELLRRKKLILENQVIFMYLVKKFKWMLVKNYGLAKL